MARLRFGAFLAPHHPIGESPTLLMRRDLDLAEQLDRLGFDEFWVGEHHSGGWETIASPELFLAAAAERTRRIRLGTGVVSLPYHHPFNVAQRIVQLDHISGGRAMLGVGPGALPSDAAMFGIEPAVQRDRMEEALGIILHLLRSHEPLTVQSEWFDMRNASIHLRPVQEELEVVVASSISPAGMKAAGRYGLGVISVATNSEEGLQALPTQWGFGETYAAENGQAMDRSKWRITCAFHLAPTREQAIAEAAEGVKRWWNEYVCEIAGRPGAKPFDSGEKLIHAMNRSGTAMVGTPDDAIEGIRRLQQKSGGFGTFLGSALDWTDIGNRLRSWDMFARYVVPRFNGALDSIEASATFLKSNHDVLMKKANDAILAAVRQHNASHPRDETPVPSTLRGS